MHYATPETAKFGTNTLSFSDRENYFAHALWTLRFLEQFLQEREIPIEFIHVEEDNQPGYAPGIRFSVALRGVEI